MVGIKLFLYAVSVFRTTHIHIQSVTPIKLEQQYNPDIVTNTNEQMN